MGRDSSPAGLDGGGHPTNSQTILVVEDEILLRLMIADVLRRRTYNVVEAANADEALSILRSGMAVDVVFTDICMPGSIDGIQLARITAADWPNVDVVLTSAIPDAGDRIGEARLFPKPYDPEDIAKHIGSLISARPSSSAGTRAISA